MEVTHMSSNQPIVGSPSLNSLSNSFPPKVSSNDDIQSMKDLKQAQTEGKNIPISEQQLIKAIERALKALEGKTTTLDFSIHDKTKHIMVKVLDKDTGAIIREIPNEKSLDFIAKLWNMAGALIDEKV
jgi:flagellar protein FlaG